MMNTRHFVWISVLVLSSCAIGPCDALQIDISPDTYTEENRGPVNVTCSLDSTDSGDVDIVLLEIIRTGGQPIVFLRPSGMLFGDDYKDSSKFQAAGTISKNIFSSYLRLSIFDPDQTDGGIYECKMFFTDLSGDLLERRIGKNFTINKINVNDVVRKLMAKVSYLEHKLEVQTAKLDNVTLTHGVDIRNLRVNAAELENITHIQGSEITDLGVKGREVSDKLDQLTHTTQALANTSQRQGSEIAELGDAISYTSAFSAGLSAHTTVAGGEDIIFNSLIMQQGDGYDVSSGVFTVPRDGEYAFNLVMMAYPDSSDRDGLAIIVVDGKHVARLLVHVPTSVPYLQSSVSTVASLTQGQKVKVYCYNGMRWHGYNYSVFTGFLIRTK